MIRLANKQDLPAVLALYAQPEFNGEATDIKTAETVFEQMSKYPFYRLFVAEFGDAIVGTFCLLVMDNIARSATPSAIIESVVVDSNHKASGIGKKMMNAAFEMAAKRGAYKICLYTGTPNDYVHQFYESLGFERHGTSYRLEPLP